ncbi:MAG: DciA family protein [Syntrophobacteria bacterium]
MQKKRRPEHIGSILKQLFQDQKWENNIEASLPLLRWQEIVGSQLARQTQPEFFKDGVLQVRVENSVWLNHLRFLAEELRQKLNEELPSLKIKELRFRQGTLDKVQSGPPSTDSHAASGPEGDAGPRQPLSQEQRRLLETISDPELRHTLETLLTKQRQRSHK